MYRILSKNLWAILIKALQPRFSIMDSIFDEWKWRKSQVTSEPNVRFLPKFIFLHSVKPEYFQRFINSRKALELFYCFIGVHCSPFAKMNRKYFLLPFIVPDFFRPTFWSLSVWSLIFRLATKISIYSEIRPYYNWSTLFRPYYNYVVIPFFGPIITWQGVFWLSDLL